MRMSDQPPNIEKLIREHYDVLYRYAFRLSGNPADAEDLTQQCFLTAHRKLRQLRDPAAARGWLFQILRNIFLKLCRKRFPVSACDTNFEIGQIIDAGPPDVPFDIERLQQRLLELPENYRVALLMFYFEGKTYNQIAMELGIAPGTVMSRLSRAKAHLRVQLSPSETVN